MSISDIPDTYASDTTDAADESERNPSRLVALLRRISEGAAADGFPWPEGYPPPGRRLALADADCTLAGLRVVQELVLAAERTRQDGEADEYVGDRIMEGLMQACIALSAHAATKIRPH